ncbi:MAG TPA: amino acid adenylation domain-containing protein, partial [Verrucomicrobiae bacterium]|jgi:amino acid adenylation domain-containing protein
VERSLEMVVGALGILKAGGAYVPMDPQYPRDRLAFICEDARPLAVLTRQKLLGQLPPNQAQMVCLDAMEKAFPSGFKNRSADNFLPQAKNLAYVIYTSGSTGKPKGVAIEHRSAVNFVHWAREIFSDAEMSGVLASTSICFDLSIFELFVTLSCGGKVIVAQNALELPRLPARNQVTLINTVPSAIAELLKEGGVPASVQVVNLAGEPLSTALVDRIYAVKNVRKVNDLYGPTETTTYSTFTLRQPGGKPTIGRPLANTQVYILDAAMQPVPVGVAGELYIGGDGLARGYLNRPDLTAEKFIADPFSGEPGARLYKTGDLSRYLSDGNIEYLGRIDQQVKIRGFRIELGEIESVLGNHPAIRECVVVARENAAGGKNLVAYLVVRKKTAPAVAELREFLLKKLPDYMVPVAFVNLEKLPLTPNGKIDRKALPEPAENLLKSGAEFAAPQTPTEVLLAKIWGELLGAERTGIRDNFFALGGHSLLAARIFFRIRDVFKLDLPVRTISRCPTIAELGVAVDEAMKAASAPAPSSACRHRAGNSTSNKFPLSFNQQQLWFLDQLEPGGSMYNVPLALRLRGGVNQAALRQSLNQLVQRHESLRTVFLNENGVPMQLVLPELAICLRTTNLEKIPEAEREAAAQRRLIQEASRPFDLGRGPLARAELFELAGEHHILLLTVHHIVFDGWSIDVLLRELCAGYAANSEGRTPGFPGLTLQFADHAIWQREYLTAERIEQHLGYWRQQLAGVPTVLELPNARPRPLVADHSGAHHVFTLPKELADALGELARGQGTTLFVTLLAAFQTLLHRCSGQQTLLVGSPMSGRTQKESEDLIGFFVNALPLKADFSGNPQFAGLLRQVHQTVWEAQDHQELPFEKLVEALQPQRDLSRNPIFQIAFVFDSATEPSPQLAGMKCESEPVRMPVVKFDLTLLVLYKNGVLQGVFEYATGIFEAEMISRLAEHFQNLLAAIVANPQEKVSDLPMLSAAGRQQLLVEWNSTAADYPHDKTIHQLFETQAEKTPEAVAVVCDEKSLTYRELNRRANQLAHRLRALGVGPDSLVGIYVGRSHELVVGLLGILKAGGAYVPLDTKNPKPRLQQQLQDIGVLLTQMELLPQLPEFAGAIVCFDRDHAELFQFAESNPAPAASPENLAYVIFTSGSTGAPKGVAIRHRNLVNYNHFISRRLGLEKFSGGLKFALVSTVAADLGNTCIYPALLSGGSLHVINDEVVVSPEDFARQVSQSEIDVLKITPSHLAALLTAENPRAVLPRRFLILGGEALTLPLVKRIRNFSGDCKIINHYGPTETTVGSLTLGEEDFALEQLFPNASVPVGRPIANTQAYILDARLQPMPVGLPGQLFIGGDGVAQGYYNNPGLTAEKFIRNPFSPDPAARLYGTGDLAKYLPDGRIEFLGRMDHQVKIRGFRIELGEIEAAIKEHPGINQCVLVVQAQASGDSRLVAYVVPADLPSAPTNEGWRDFLKQKLPDYMLPAAFVNLAKLPLNANGKLDRKALPAPEEIFSGSGANFIAPRTPAEQALAKIWRELLGVEQVGVHDNFFALGGHSLMAVRLANEIKQELKFQLPVRMLFQHPTIHELAAILQGQKSKERKPELIQLSAGRSGPELYFLVDEGSLGWFKLAHYLGKDQRLCASVVPLPEAALKAAGKKQSSQLPRMEDWAAEHVALIKSRHAAGPVLLAGHCFGGVLAFEVARQLQVAGISVPAVLQLDTWMANPSFWWEKKAWLREHFGKLLKQGPLYLWRKGSRRIGLEKQETAAKLDLAIRNDFNLHVPWSIIVRIYRHAMKGYQPRPLAGRGILFLSQADWLSNAYRPLDGTLGAGRLFAGGVEVINVPGDHVTVLNEEHLPELARQFDKCLEQFR